MKRWTAWLAVVAALIYAVMWVGWVQHWGWLAAVDRWSLDGYYRVALRHPLWVPVWNVLCTVLSPTTFRIAGVVLIIWMLARRRLRLALFLVVSVEIGGLVTEVAKRLADRPRPDTQMVYAYGTSFPSGHAMGAMVGVLALLTVAWPGLAHRWRIPLAVLGGVAIVVVGIGRVALNVHYPSDVVAGWALGYLYYLLCLALLRPTGERRAESGTAK
jgi:membrane-associated phospholipid phosphatase